MKKNLKSVILFLVLVSIITVSYVYAQQETEKPAAAIKEDSGTYLGQIDPHSIEIGISGVPEELAPRAFQLSSRVQEEFAGYGLKTGDQVKFIYTVAEPSCNYDDHCHRKDPKLEGKPNSKSTWGRFFCVHYSLM